MVVLDLKFSIKQVEIPFINLETRLGITNMRASTIELTDTEFKEQNKLQQKYEEGTFLHISLSQWICGNPFYNKSINL